MPNELYKGRLHRHTAVVPYVYWTLGRAELRSGILILQFGSHLGSVGPSEHL